MICPFVRANTDERSCNSTFAAEADDCRRSIGQDTLVLSESIPQDSGTLSFKTSARFVVSLRRADWPLKYVKDQVFHVALGTHLLSLSSVSEIVNCGHVGSSWKPIIVRRQVVYPRLDGPLLTLVQALNAFKVSRSKDSLPVMMERQRTCSSSAPPQTARRRATLTPNAYGHDQKQHVRLPDHEIVMRQAATRTPYVGNGRYAPLLKECLT